MSLGRRHRRRLRNQQPLRKRLVRNHRNLNLRRHKPPRLNRDRARRRKLPRKRNSRLSRNLLPNLNSPNRNSKINRYHLLNRNSPARISQQNQYHLPNRKSPDRNKQPSRNHLPNRNRPLNRNSVARNNRLNRNRPLSRNGVARNNRQQNPWKRHLRSRNLRLNKLRKVDCCHGNHRSRTITLQAHSSGRHLAAISSDRGGNPLPISNVPEQSKGRFFHEVQYSFEAGGTSIVRIGHLVFAAIREFQEQM